MKKYLIAAVAAIIALIGLDAYVYSHYFLLTQEDADVVNQFIQLLYNKAAACKSST